MTATVPVGYYVRQNLASPWSGQYGQAASDPMFSAVTQEIFGISPPDPAAQVSLKGQPQLFMEFFNWAGTYQNAPPNTNTSIVTSTARYIMFDDSVSTFTYYDVGSAGTATFTNRTDWGNGTSTGNWNNLGCKRFVEYVRQQMPGTTAVITWRSGGVDGTNNMENASGWQDEFSLANIVAGNHDTFIKAYGSQIGDYLFAHPTMKIQLRLDQEMNGNNYGWAYNQSWANPGTPTNGPKHLNALTQTATSGNPIVTAHYGLYAQMYQRVVRLLKQSIVARLVNLGKTLGTTSTAGTALFICNASFQTIWCVGSGSQFPTVANAPLAGNQTVIALPFTQVGDLYNGRVESINNIVFSGSVATVTLNFPQTGGSAKPVGHSFPIGSVLAFTSTGTTLDSGTFTVTGITNTTFTVASAVSASTVTPGSATCTLSGVTSYVNQISPWISFYPGDGVDPTYGLPDVDILSIDGYQAQHVGTGWKLDQDIFDSNSNGAYSSLAAAIATKPFQISETACIENPAAVPLQTLSTTTGSPDGAITSGNLVTSNTLNALTTGAVGLQVTGTGIVSNTYITAMNNIGTTAAPNWQGTLSTTCTNATGLLLVLDKATFADGVMVVTGGGTSVKVNSAALYNVTTSNTAWIVSGNSFPAYAFVKSVAGGQATMTFPFGGGPTSNGTTTGLTFSMKPPQKSDWVSINYLTASSLSIPNIFPRMTAGVIIFNHNSVKPLSGFVGTYDLRSSPSCLAAWRAVMSEASTSWITPVTLTDYPSPASIGTTPSTIIVRDGLSSSTTVAFRGEPFFFTDTSRFGISDGITASNVIGTALLSTDKGVASGVASLDSTGRLIPTQANKTTFFTSSGSFTIPASATLLRISGSGGGGQGAGAGGATGTTLQAGGGGGGAGQAGSVLVAVGAATTLTVTIGAGGSATGTGGAPGSPGISGTNGTQTQITGTGITVNFAGGSGGNPSAGNSVTAVLGGCYGQGSGNSVNLNGAPGTGAGSAGRGGDALAYSGAGGGGGGPATTTLGGGGGGGGGGTGAGAGGTKGTSGASGTATGVVGVAASANTGGGGGGGGGGAAGTGTGGAGGAGGSGWALVEVVQ